MGMTTTLGWMEHIRIRQLNSLAQLGDSMSTRKLLLLGDGGCRVCTKKMGDSMFTMIVMLLGQWGTPLGQQKTGGRNIHNKIIAAGQWGMLHVHQNGGLNIHNESIATRARGDAAWATNLGDSMSTTKLLPPGDGGSRVCAKKMGDSTSTMKLSPLRQEGTPLWQQNGGTQCPQ